MERKPKFVLYTDKAGEHRWRLVDTNGRGIADSSEGYVDRNNVFDAVKNVRQAIVDAEVESE